MDTGKTTLSVLFWTFLKIGATAFGGFMALISVVQNVVVERKKLLRHADMLDGVSLASLLPGPVAVNLVAYVGYRLRGAPGALVAAAAVILPSFLLILALSLAYFRYGQIPLVSKLFMGFVPAVAAIILAAAWAMGRQALGSVREVLLGVVAAGLLIGVGGFAVTLVIIVGAGLIGLVLFRNEPARPRARGRKPRSAARDDDTPAGMRLFSLAAPLAAAPLLAVNAGALTALFLVFAGMSLMLFGGGYVFIPLIQEIVVDGRQWVTRQEFVDAIAMGQITPGPILISAAFIGLKVGGLAGALVATVAIFAPPAVLMVIATRLLDRLQRSRAVQSALRGVRAAVVGLIAAAAVTVARTAALHWASLLIFAAVLVATLKWKIEVVWLIPAAGAAGLLLY
ncbi:MAG TPA: chromate efflux transporter [Acidiferrobacterales bacterium]